ncbi:phage portal protein [Altericroceibacterium endophyticum]|uniref:Phage portal protein n=1 Tax=Altericroceibacterium endophyticum TaxID=1808508 RepID=A0A6I4T8Z8_9SPHN|nr:phage portal protein [Altericroceibacterium endophyticum]MXO66235.1 phage portal protein [Altericroceibacterium endophyticum]
MSTDEAPEAKAGITAFALDDAVGVLDRRDLLGFSECWWNGRWYEPPVKPRDLAQMLQSSAHHGSAIRVKRNLLVKHFIPHRLLSRDEFARFALDFLVTGNAFLELVPNIAGRVAELKNSLAVNTRRGRDGQYWFVEKWSEAHPFAPGHIFHLLEHDPAQELYGRAEYLSAMQSLLLNESATLFRRRYYLNGAHAGFVFYVSEPSMSDHDIDEIREALRQAQGKGNFRNLFLHAPNGKKDGVQVIPISEVAAKDEFFNIKNVTRDDILAAHRVPPQLLGVIPQNNGGFGDVRTAADIFFVNEIEPLMMRLREVNDWLGRDVVRFTEHQPSGPALAA